MPHAAAPSHARFVRTRRIIFGIALAGYILSFFHRTAPAAIAGELTRTFAINSAVLGTIAATYFYVYTLLQIPVGVLADTMGPRRILTVGSLIAAAGSLAFALAPSWEIAAAGRTLVGAGVSVAFIALLKISAVWFPPNRFATLNGVTMFAGNLGAVIAGAPLAWLVTEMSWRSVFTGLALVSAVLGVATWIIVRDRPEQRGFAPVNVAGPTHGLAERWPVALRRVLTNPATWPGFFVNLGIGGSFLAFAGLWAVPFLVDRHGMSRVVAAQHASALLLGVAFGALIVGTLSDRLGNRRAVMRAYAWLYALSWLPWVAGVAVAAAGDARVVRADGLADSWIHADVDGREGSEPPRTLRHGDGGSECRHLPRHRNPAAPCRVGARSRPGRGRSRGRMELRNRPSRGRRALRRADDDVRPRADADRVTFAQPRAIPSARVVRGWAARRSACGIR